MLRTLFVILSGFVFVACSSTNHSVETVEHSVRGNRQFVFERSWARQTTVNTYLGFRIDHVMKPLIYKDFVIQGNEIDGITAYDKISGHRRWHRDIVGGVTAEGKIHGDMVYFGAGDGFFYALDAKTGNTRWSFPIRSEGIGAPLVTDDAIYFETGTNSAYALNPETGSQIWFYNRQDSNAITVRGASEPTLYNGRVYLGFSDGYLVALDKTKGVMVWEKQLSTGQRFRDVDSKPVIDDGRVYVSSYDGQLFCLNADLGTTIWTHDDGGFLPVTIDGGTIYYSTSSRKMQAIEKASGKLIWSIDLANTVGSQPMLYRGLLLFGEWSGKLRAVDARNGESVISFNTGRGVTSGVTLDSSTDRLYVMTLDANIYSLRLRLKKQSEYLPWEI